MTLEIVGHFFSCKFTSVSKHSKMKTKGKDLFYDNFTYNLIRTLTKQNGSKYKLFLLKTSFPVSCVLLYQIHYFQILWDSMMPNKYKNEEYIIIL